MDDSKENSKLNHERLKAGENPSYPSGDRR